ncbi:MAG: hypothetical protein OHK0026_12230 [Rhodocyclaceae bacterium]
MTDTKHRRLALRLHTALHGLDGSAILRSFDLALWFGTHWASGVIARRPGPGFADADRCDRRASGHG